MIYLIIEKYKSEYVERYDVKKYTKDLKEANKFLSALSLLEDSANITFMIVPMNDTPLVLKNEVA
jgi:endo-alpha-1,4-polygalactosaminidase (GH114 family)